MKFSFLDFLKQRSGNPVPHSYVKRLPYNATTTTRMDWAAAGLPYSSPLLIIFLTDAPSKLPFAIALGHCFSSQAGFSHVHLPLVSSAFEAAVSLLDSRKSQLYHFCCLTISEKSHSSVGNWPHQHVIRERRAQCCRHPRNPQRDSANCWSLGKEEWVRCVHNGEQCQQTHHGWCARGCTLRLQFYFTLSSQSLNEVDAII